MITIHNFQSLSAWIDKADRNSSQPGMSNSSENPRLGFAGVSTKEEAFKLFRHGHPEGCQRMKEVLEGLQSSITLPTMYDVFENDVQGCAPNVEAFIQGIPEDMFVISQIESNAPPSTLTVQFELCYAARITPEQATLGGAVVFAAMEALRMQGCNVTCLMSHTSANEIYRQGDIWQATAPIPNSLDMDSLAFIFTHPAMLRVIMFSMMEAEPREVRERQSFYAGAAYGYPTTHKNPDADVMIEMAKICNQIHSAYGTPPLESARLLLRELVRTRFGTLQNEEVAK